MRSKFTAERICDAMKITPEVQEWDELIDWDAGEWEMRLIREVKSESNINHPVVIVIGF